MQSVPFFTYIPPPSLNLQNVRYTLLYVTLLPKAILLKRQYEKFRILYNEIITDIIV